MKKDTEVKLYMQERRKGTTQRIAAARAGISERTARTYEQAGKWPSQLRRPHDWNTRSDPFEQDWPWIVAQLERDPALQGSTLFALLCERHPERYRPTQVRTLQRHIAHWKALHGKPQEVIYECCPLRFGLLRNTPHWGKIVSTRPSALFGFAYLTACQWTPGFSSPPSRFTG